MARNSGNDNPFMGKKALVAERLGSARPLTESELRDMSDALGSDFKLTEGELRRMLRHHPEKFVDE